MSDAQYNPSRTWLLTGVILALGLIGAGWVLGSQIKETRLGDRYVTVKGLAERTVKSDLAVWNISFRSSGDDFKTVLTEGQSQRQTVLAFLKQLGVTEDEIAIGSPNVIDREAQEYGSIQGRQSPVYPYSKYHRDLNER